MCLSIPKKVISISDSGVVLENIDGSRQNVRSILKLKAGEFVITQGGVVIQKMNQKEAEETFELLRKEERHAAD